MRHQTHRLGLVERALSFLFPLRLPSPIRDWEDREEQAIVEQGCAGPAKRKKYRDGVERHFAEQKEEAQKIKTLQLTSY